MFFFQTDLDESVQSTSSAIHHRLLCKIRTIEEQRRFRCAEQQPPADQSDSAELFCFKSVVGDEDSFIGPTTSMASRLISNAALKPAGRFDEYAKFEALVCMYNDFKTEMFWSFLVIFLG